MYQGTICLSSLSLYVDHVSEAELDMSTPGHLLMCSDCLLRSDNRE